MAVSCSGDVSFFLYRYRWYSHHWRNYELSTEECLTFSMKKSIKMHGWVFQQDSVLNKISWEAWRKKKHVKGSSQSSNVIPIKIYRKSWRIKLGSVNYLSLLSWRQYEIKDSQKYHWVIAWSLYFPTTNVSRHSSLI